MTTRPAKSPKRVRKTAGGVAARQQAAFAIIYSKTESTHVGMPRPTIPVRLFICDRGHYYPAALNGSVNGPVAASQSGL
jgi:hypothetical protein